jgi:hypothetical protein
MVQYGCCLPAQIDGAHDISRFQAVTERVVSETVAQMWRKVGVSLSAWVVLQAMIFADFRVLGLSEPSKTPLKTVKSQNP